MADYIIHETSEDNFFNLLEKHDFTLVNKMVTSISRAITKNKKEVDIFEIVFPDKSSLVFTIKQDKYKGCLEHCLIDFEKQELYEECIKIKQTIEKL